ncbi:HAD family hydrolase [Polaromonas sp.]|uniref:HAD family hydrolase n=1 Tax=Polaromonas sp. TaxID=1869339 RepID=UPI003BAC74B5
MLDLKRIKAVTLDLDDTLWPVWPAIERAEKALENWLSTHAPMTAALFSNVVVRNEIRAHVVRTRPELKHDMGAIRREAIRLALYRSRENPLLAEQGYEIFFAERNRVTLFEDALQALEFLSARFPVVALSNGNADIERIGLQRYFRANVSAQAFGVGKPDPRIFHAAAGAVDTVPENVLHIGDDAMLDVLGGLNAGMQTVWLNRAASEWKHAEKPHITVGSLTELCDFIAA